jgi:hypothetical protein
MQPPLPLTLAAAGQTANLTGWRITNSDTRTEEAAMNLVFGLSPCESAGNSTIEPSRSLTLYPRSDTAPCGYPFALSFR